MGVLAGELSVEDTFYADSGRQSVILLSIPSSSLNFVFRLTYSYPVCPTPPIKDYSRAPLIKSKSG